MGGSMIIFLLVCNYVHNWCFFSKIHNISERESIFFLIKINSVFSFSVRSFLSFSIILFRCTVPAWWGWIVSRSPLTLGSTHIQVLYKINELVLSSWEWSRKLYFDQLIQQLYPEGMSSNKQTYLHYTWILSIKETVQEH